MAFLAAFLKGSGRALFWFLGGVFFLALFFFAVSRTYRSQVCVQPAARPEISVGRSVPERDAIPGYLRDADTTYLTYPEWYIVWSAQEYSDFLDAGVHPSAFPYLQSVAQFWCGYGYVHEFTSEHFGFNAPENIALTVIGSSFSVQYLVLGLYENTIGRLSELDGAQTFEDSYMAVVARDYGSFLQQVPFYDYPYAQKLAVLWSSTPLWEEHPLRAWERKIFLSVGYGFETGYGWLIGTATLAAYGPEPTEIMMQIVGLVPDSIAEANHIRVVRTLADGTEVIAVPNYQRFTEIITIFAGNGIKILNIAGHGDILVSAVVPETLSDKDIAREELFEQPILTHIGWKRIVLVVPVQVLEDTVRRLAEIGVSLEHVYDYI